MLERSLQAPAGSVQDHPGVALAEIERLGDLARPEPEVDSQADSGGLAGQQGGQSGLDGLRKLVELGAYLGSGLLVGELDGAVGVVEPRQRCGGSAAPFVGGGIAGDLEHPRPELARLPERVKLGERTGEALLDEVTLTLRVAHGVRHCAANPPSVAPVELGEGLDVAAPHPLDQARVVTRSARRDRSPQVTVPPY